MSSLAPYYHEKYNTKPKVFMIIKYWLKEVRVKDPCDIFFLINSCEVLLFFTSVMVISIH
jgi:hypothetical protein